jgi:hypothetical protein
MQGIHINQLQVRRITSWLRIKEGRSLEVERMFHLLRYCFILLNREVQSGLRIKRKYRMNQSLEDVHLNHRHLITNQWVESENLLMVINVLTYIQELRRVNIRRNRIKLRMIMISMCKSRNVLLLLRLMMKELVHQKLKSIKSKEWTKSWKECKKLSNYKWKEE